MHPNSIEQIRRVIREGDLEPEDTIPFLDESVEAQILSEGYDTDIVEIKYIKVKDFLEEYGNE